MTALDFLTAVFDFDYSIDKLPFTDEAERRLEQFALESRRHVRNNDYQTGVQLCAAIECQEVGSFVTNVQSRSKISLIRSQSFELPKPR